MITKPALVFASLISLFYSQTTFARNSVRSVKRDQIIISKPSPNPKPTATPTQKPIPTATKVPTATLTPTPTPTLQPTDPIKEFLMKAINDYRLSQGLAEVKTDPYTCDFAKIRVQEITQSFSHDGFRDRINNDTLPYPSYSKITENLAENSDYRDVVNTWIASTGHAENMRADTPYVCVEKNGDFYAYEGWKP